jgi:nucleoid-associated protein YgaU
VVTRGESLSQIAWQELGDPARWRDLADANRGVDIIEPEPGSILTIPPIDLFRAGSP